MKCSPTPFSIDDGNSDHINSDTCSVCVAVLMMPTLSVVTMLHTMLLTVITSTVKPAVCGSTAGAYAECCYNTVYHAVSSHHVNSEICSLSQYCWCLHLSVVTKLHTMLLTVITSTVTPAVCVAVLMMPMLSVVTKLHTMLLTVITSTVTPAVCRTTDDAYAEYCYYTV